AILDELTALEGKMRPDDVFLLYLGGHGFSVSELQQLKGEDGKPRLAPDRLQGLRGFLFCCPDLSFENLRDTTVTFDDVYQRLIKLRCHKLVLLDACHSGEAGRFAAHEDE